MNHFKSLFYIIASIFAFSFIGASAEEVVCENKEPKKTAITKTKTKGNLRMATKTNTENPKIRLIPKPISFFRRLPKSFIAVPIINPAATIFIPPNAAETMGSAWEDS